MLARWHRSKPSNYTRFRVGLSLPYKSADGTLGRRTTFVLACGLLLALPLATWAREWTDSTGKFSVEAELVKVHRGYVALKRTDGLVINVPITRLSMADRRYLESERQRVAGPRQLLITSNRTGNWDIFLMNEDGSEATNLTNHDADDSGPAWSPDGRQIVFASNRTGNFDLYVMDADGSDVRQLTHDPLREGWPAWSPDGNTIVFTRLMSDDEPDSGEIFRIKSDGTEETNITNDPAHDSDSAWSPDGTKILFVSNRADEYQLYLMSPNGEDVERLLSRPAGRAYPAWSPDGKKVVFGGADLIVYDFGTGQHRELTIGRKSNRYPAWSPDGWKIAFQSHPRRGAGTLHTMNADGSDVRMILENETKGWLGGGRPAWRPTSAD